MGGEVLHSAWETAILEQFDKYASEYRFAMPDNAYLYMADMRLKVFRGASEWLIIIG